MVCVIRCNYYVYIIILRKCSYYYVMVLCLALEGRVRVKKLLFRNVILTYLSDQYQEFTQHFNNFTEK